MSEYSIRSNMQSIFTDCPHREKLGWLADMIQSMGAIHSNFDVSRLPAQHAAATWSSPSSRAGSIPGTAPEFPNFGGGYRDDVNWGGAFIITPYFLWQTYGDTRTMREYYAPMQDYLAYVRAQIGANGLLVSGLGDWIAGDTTTPKDATGTYGLYVIADRHGARWRPRWARPPTRPTTARWPTALASAFNAAFFNPATKTYTTEPAHDRLAGARRAAAGDGHRPRRRQAVRARRPRRAHQRLPPQRRRPAHQRRRGRRCSRSTTC